MAIDPSIALGIRPVQIPQFQIQSPLERFQRVQSLRQLMEQGQYRALQMQQLQQEMEAARQAQQREQAFMESFRNPQPETAAPTVQPTATPAGTEGFFPATPPPPAPPRLPSTAQTLGILGTKGLPVVKTFAELETERRKAEVERVKAERDKWDSFGAIAGTAKDEKTKNTAVTVAMSRGLLTPEQARALLARPFDAGEYEQFRTSAIEAKNQAEDALKRAQLPGAVAKSLGEQLAVAAQSVPNNQSDWTRWWTEDLSPQLQKLIPPMYSPTAEQMVLKRGLTPEQRVTTEGTAATRAEQARHNLQMERHDRAMEARAAQATAAGLTNAQTSRALQIAGQFDNEPMVRNFNVIAEANNFVKSLGEKGGGNAGDDQALLYSFAKAMDPGSVVREGEYSTVQKYAQSWAQSFGFKVERIFSNSPFLSDDARKQMKDTIAKKAASAKSSYDNIYKEYGRRIEGQGVQNGTDFLTNYGKAFEGAPPPPKPQSLVEHVVNQAAPTAAPPGLTGPEPRVVPGAPAVAGQPKYRTGQPVTRNGEVWVYIGPGNGDDWREQKNWKKFQGFEAK